MKRLVCCLAVLSCLAPLLCSSVGTAAAQQELIVSAAASLTNAFGDIGKQFEAAHPGTKVVFNFGASGALLQQLSQGAPVDVFASADQEAMDQAQNKNLIVPETRADFVSNSLVLIVPKEVKVSVRSLDDLKASSVTRVALGNPETVPAGRYAKEALLNAGLWDELAPKCILGNTVRQVLDYVSRGEVDAGFVFATDAAMAKEKVSTVLSLGQHKPILYPTAVVAGSEKKDAARRFVEFTRSDEGRQILNRYGFGKP